MPWKDSFTQVACRYNLETALWEYQHFFFFYFKKEHHSFFESYDFRPWLNSFFDNDTSQTTSSSCMNSAEANKRVTNGIFYWTIHEQTDPDSLIYPISPDRDKLLKILVISCVIELDNRLYDSALIVPILVFCYCWMLLIGFICCLIFFPTLFLTWGCGSL